MTMRDPELLLPAWGWDLRDLSADHQRQVLFAHLISIYASLGFNLGVTNERQLRDVTLRHLFSGEAGRRYWERMGAEATPYHPGRNGPGFYDVAQEEYTRAIASGPAALPFGSSHPARIEQPRRAVGGRTSRRILARIGIGIGTVAALSALAHRLRSGRTPS